MDEGRRPDEQREWEAKIARLHTGAPPRVLDLFAGCGGMSLGFRRAGHQILAGLEIDPNAALTHATNFFSSDDEAVFKRHSASRDITQLSPQQFMQQVLVAEDPRNLVDIITGGPPCQAFARVGRAKLRAVAQDPQAFRVDERASLYLRYLAYVAYFHPLAVLVENVPDIMNFGGQNVAEEIVASLEELGYRCRYTILNSAHYGVPQMRHRFYLIAILDALGIEPSFPEPTHYIQLPPGYDNVRTVALGATRPPARGRRRASPDGNGPAAAPETAQMPVLNQRPPRYVAPPDPSRDRPPAVTAWNAIGDLPVIKAHLRGPMPGGRRKFDTLLRYRPGRPSAYSLLMRHWPGLVPPGGVRDHVTRYLPRDFPIFSRMQPGDEYPRAHALALELFQQELARIEQEIGAPLVEESGAYKALKKKIVPPYKTDKFPNKWWKLRPDQPVRTLTAHIGKDTYTHIHYDSDQAREITVREAARLQSFPDGFRFIGPMNPAFTQIGNAVPPLQATALGTHILALLQQAAAPAPRWVRVVLPAPHLLNPALLVTAEA